MSPSRSLEGWRPPPELAGSPPRTVRWTRRGISQFALFTTMTVGVSVFAVWGFQASLRRQADKRREIQESRETAGTVTALSSLTGLGVHWYASYSYSVDGREFHNRRLVSQQHWDILRVGSPIDISYIPSQPARSFPTADPPAPLPVWPKLAILISLAAVFLWAEAMTALQLRRRRRCLERGRPAPAVVTGLQRKRSRSGTYFAVSYEFRLPDGGAGRNRYNDGSQPPQQGAVICILYDPDQLRLSVPYPVMEFRVAAI